MPFTVMRTAAGASVAPFTIQQLRSVPDVRVIAVDIDRYASGFHFADAAYVVPRVGSPGFLERMLEICERESVDLLFPDLDEELVLLAEARERFHAVGTRVLVSASSALAVCTDKFRTHQFFVANEIPSPHSVLPEEIPERVEFPLIVKPRSGRGGSGVHRVRNRRELDFFLDYVDRPIVQECLEGMEYTVDTMSDLEGRYLYCSVRERLATDSGISTRGRTVVHGEIAGMVERIVGLLGLVGPGCVQCFELPGGELRFTEINPRIAGSAVLSMAAGAPIVTDAVRLARGEEPEGLRSYRPGTVMLRYWEQIFLDEAAASPVIGGRAEQRAAAGSAPVVVGRASG
jgi:carbamoyl-phosphate synthase large subunit